MRKFVSFGPAFVTLLTAGVVVVAVPAAVRRIEAEHTEARVRLAQQRLDQDDVLIRLNEAVRSVAESVEPSVVHLEVVDRGEGRGWRGSSGSGWVFDGNGHIVTNAHVVSGVDSIRVQTFDARVLRAKVVDVDPMSDVAVLKVEDQQTLIPIRRATGERVRVGERVFAFGSPFGFKFSMSEGIVSGLGRTARTPLGTSGLSNFIQTDAAVNPGNSGGPLVDVRGRLVGMNVAIATAQDSNGASEGQSAGISFAIPLQTIESRVQQMIGGGPIVSGYLGVSFMGGDPSLFIDQITLARGVRVGETQPGSPAEQAGLKVGDLITSINGEPVANGDVLRSIISTTSPGETVTLGVIRDRETLELKATLAEMPKSAQARPYREMLRDQAGLRLSESQDGVFIAAAATGGLARQAGLEQGQRLTMVDGKPVSTIDEVVDLLRLAGLFSGKAASITVERTDAEGKTDSKTVSLSVSRD